MPPPALRRSRNFSARATSSRRSACQRPPDVHDRVLLRREPLQLVGVEPDVADRELPVELRDRRRREKPARAARPCARVRFARMRVGARTHACGTCHRHAARLELRHQRAQEERRVLRVQLDFGRLVGVELDPVLGEERPERGEALRDVLVRIGVAQKRNASAPSPRAASRAARATGRPTRAATARARAHRPRRARRDAGRASTAPRSRGRGRRRPSASPSSRATRTTGRPADPAPARRAQSTNASTARERLTRVGSTSFTPAATSRSRAIWSTSRGYMSPTVACDRRGSTRRDDRRERCGQPGERLLDRRVERRAPEREPAPAAAASAADAPSLRRRSVGARSTHREEDARAVAELCSGAQEASSASGTARAGTSTSSTSRLPGSPTGRSAEKVPSSRRRNAYASPSGCQISSRVSRTTRTS